MFSHFRHILSLILWLITFILSEISLIISLIFPLSQYSQYLILCVFTHNFLIYHSFGFKYFSSRTHFSRCCFNSIPIMGLRNLSAHLNFSTRTLLVSLFSRTQKLASEISQNLSIQLSKSEI